MKFRKPDKSSKKRFIVWAIISLFFLLIALYVNQTKLSRNKDIIQSGVYSYQDVSIPQKLVGDWAFVWNELLEYDDYDQISTFIHAPSFWNMEGDYNEFGYATYMLKVTDLIKGQAYGIRIPTLGTAGKVYINEKLVAQKGVLGQNEETHQPKYKISYVDITAEDTSFIIVVQISNYDYPRAGMWLPIQISSAKNMMHFRNTKMGVEHVTLGMLFFTLILSISIIIAIRAPLASHNFIGTIIFAFMHQIVYGEKLILYWFPNISMASVVKIQYLVMYGMALFCLRTINHFCKDIKYQHKILNIVINIYSVIGSILALSVIIAPLYFTTSIIGAGKVFTYIGIAICIILVVEAFVKNKPSMEYILASSLFLSVCIIHDFLYRATIISAIDEITVFGYIAVILAVGGLLLIDTIRIQEKAKLSRTYEQAYLNSQINSHFLFNTLNTITNMVRKDGKLAEELIVCLSTYLRNTAVRENLKEVVSIKKELETLEAYAYIIENRFENIKIVVEVEDSFSAKIPPMTLQPLVENAVVHGLRKNKRGGKVSVSLKKYEGKHIISVCDDGIGIDEHKLADLQSHLINDSGMIKSEKGIGLVNVNTRLINSLNTSLSIRSIPGRGTEVSFII